MPKKEPEPEKAKELSEAEVEVLREVFNAFDADGGGSIDVDEMHSAMKSLGAESSKADIKKLMDEIDEDGVSPRARTTIHHGPHARAQPT